MAKQMLHGEDSAKVGKRPFDSGDRYIFKTGHNEGRQLSQRYD